MLYNERGDADTGQIQCGHLSLGSIDDPVTGVTSETSPCRDQLVFPLDEQAFCSCPAYTAQPVGDWSDCIIDDKRAPGDQRRTSLAELVPERDDCGIGTRSQAVVCVGDVPGNASASLCYPISGTTGTARSSTRITEVT